MESQASLCLVVAKGVEGRGMESSDVPWSEFQVDGFALHSRIADSDPDLWIAVQHRDESWTCLCVRPGRVVSSHGQTRAQAHQAAAEVIRSLRTPAAPGA
jgi:hypothetical protein